MPTAHASSGIVTEQASPVDAVAMRWVGERLTRLHNALREIGSRPVATSELSSWLYIPAVAIDGMMLALENYSKIKREGGKWRVQLMPESLPMIVCDPNDEWTLSDAKDELQDITGFDVTPRLAITYFCAMQILMRGQQSTQK